MNFICNGAELSDAVNTVSKALQGNRNIPALEGIKIKTAENGITLAAYCTDLYIEKTIKAEVLEDGETVINGKIFCDYSNKLSSVNTVRIQKSVNDVVSLKFNQSAAEIKYYDFKNFPSLGEGESNDYFSLKERDAKELFERVIFCVANTGNETRPILKTCNILLSHDTATAAGLDGFRIGISKKKVKTSNGKLNCNVQGKNVGDICKILGESDDIVVFSKVGNSLLVNLGHTKIKTALVDGEFYKYENSVPKIDLNITAAKSDLETALTRASIISRESYSNSVKLRFFDGLIRITCENEKGRCDEVVACDYKGKEILMNMNVKFLQDAIGRIKEDALIIKAESNEKPMVITRKEGDEYRCVIMPVRLL